MRELNADRFKELTAEEKVKQYETALVEMPEAERIQLHHAARTCIDFALMEMSACQFDNTHPNAEKRKKDYYFWLKNFSLKSVHRNACRLGEQEYEQIGNGANNCFLSKYADEEDIILLRGYIWGLLQMDLNESSGH
ncbi:hypothetical protein KKG71_00080 [Patescibacteria group bacterium]|nr:hypothetical protein [Patescibacteria group bacterium]